MIIIDFRYFKRISFGQRNTCCCKNGTVVLTLRYSSQFSCSSETCFTLQVLYVRTLQSIVTFLLFNVDVILENQRSFYNIQNSNFERKIPSFYWKVFRLFLSCCLSSSLYFPCFYSLYLSVLLFQQETGLEIEIIILIIVMKHHLSLLDFSFSIFIFYLYFHFLFFIFLFFIFYFHIRAHIQACLPEIFESLGSLIRTGSLGRFTAGQVIMIK